MLQIADGTAARELSQPDRCRMQRENGERAIATSTLKGVWCPGSGRHLSFIESAPPDSHSGSGVRCPLSTFHPTVFLSSYVPSSFCPPVPATECHGVTVSGFHVSLWCVTGEPLVTLVEISTVRICPTVSQTVLGLLRPPFFFSTLYTLRTTITELSPVFAICHVFTNQRI